MRRDLAFVWLVTLGLVAAAWVELDPNVAFVGNEPSGSWILFPEPVELGRRPIGMSPVTFRAGFRLERPQAASVELEAMKEARLKLDGKVLWSTPEESSWKEAQRVELVEIPAGAHELSVDVLDDHGPGLLRLSARGLGLATGPGWQASREGGPWAPARAANEPREADISERFPSVPESFSRCLWWLVPLFVLVAAVSRLGVPLPPPAAFRFILMAAWGALSVRDFWRFPLHAGFDAYDHLRYVWFILENGRLPLANDGWQMFQAPLYYIMSAPLYALGTRFATPDTAVRLMRVIPLVCGGLQIELAYRLLRRVWHERGDLQRLGCLFAACLPMNVYISQAPGNEPLAAFLIAAVIVGALSLGERPSDRDLAGLGLLLGFAALAKVTSLLLIPPLAWLVASRKDYRKLGWVLGAMALACGWFFLRNWVEAGSPLFAFGTPKRLIDWWQDPGYRSWSQLWFWGGALTRPIYSATLGIWDSFYSTFWLDGYLSGVVVFDARPPWNYDLMIAGAWLALLPTAAMLIGLSRAIQGTTTQSRIFDFVLMCVAAFFAAFVIVYLQNPVYSTGKATYTLGLMPCYALLLCGGLDRMSRTALSRSLVYAGMACWAVASYGAYFIR